MKKLNGEFLKKLTVIGYLACFLTVQSCNKVEEPILPSKVIDLSSAELDANRTAFSKILAKAIADEDVRGLLKREALKQFDKDYDVLYQMVKKVEIRPGTTFSDYLASFSESKEKFEAITESLPLLTILVPDLPKFSASNWDISTQVPVIAVRNNEFKKDYMLPTFSHTGEEFSTYAKTQPSTPIIVVKENERVTIDKNEINQSNNIADNKPFFQNGRNTFYFIDEAYDIRRHAASRLIRVVSNLDPAVQYAYDNKATYQRDYVYYGILSSPSSGAFKPNFSEYITSISLFDVNVADNSVYDDPVTDFSDGTLEFYVDILYVDNNNAVTPLRKVISAPYNQLYITATTGEKNAVAYTLPTPIEIFSWDLQRYGDTWKFVVNEYDAPTTTTTTITHNITTEYGGNFSFDLSLGIIKIGAGYNGSTTSVASKNEVVQINGTPDFLGEGLLKYIRPIVICTPISPMFPNMCQKSYYEVTTGTGGVALVIESKKVN